jgi:Uma2 family endonuclease
MAHYAHDFYEWVKGELIKMSPVSGTHDTLTRYLSNLLEAYLSLNPIGSLREEPFLLHLDATESRREPDLQIILNNNPGTLTETAMIGPADICIEVVSQESVARDHGEKFAEYEKAGVGEYWIIDPLRQICRFNRLNEQGLYIPLQFAESGVYETPILPGFRLDVEVLWREKLPGYFEIGEAAKEMVREG